MRTHIPSALSMKDYVHYILDTYIDYKRDNIILGKVFGKDAYLSYAEDFFDYVKFQDVTLFNALGVALGISYKNPVKTWLNISDSQIESGIYYEFLQNITKDHNLLVTVDYNRLKLRSQIKVNLDALVKLAPSIIVDGHKPFQVLQLPIVVYCKTIKGKGVLEIERDPMKYHYVIEDERLYEKAIVQLYPRK